MASLTTDMVKQLLNQGKKASQIAKQYGITRQAVYCHIYKLKHRKKPASCKPKKNYNSLIDWKIYNEGLVKRGEILLDFELFENWQEELDLMNANKRGRPYYYPEALIWFLTRLKSIFEIDYRTLEGIGRKLIVFISQATRAPDYTTLEVRFKQSEYMLDVYQGLEEEQSIALDSSGLKTSNRGEYRISKYKGKRRKFVKLHIGVNIMTHQVVACSVTPEEISDGKELPKIIEAGENYGKIKCALLDAGYDSKANHLMLANKGMKVIIKPRKTMSLEKVNQEIRKEEDKARLLRLKTLKEYLEDEELWKGINGYGKRWEAEGRYSVFKRVFGEHVFSRKMENIRKEVILKVSLMNLFASLTSKALYEERSWVYKKALVEK